MYMIIDNSNIVWAAWKWKNSPIHISVEAIHQCSFTVCAIGHIWWVLIFQILNLTRMLLQRKSSCHFWEQMKNIHLNWQCGTWKTVLFGRGMFRWRGVQRRIISETAGWEDTDCTRFRKFQDESKGISVFDGNSNCKLRWTEDGNQSQWEPWEGNSRKWWKVTKASVDFMFQWHCSWSMWLASQCHKIWR